MLTVNLRSMSWTRDIGSKDPGLESRLSMDNSSKLVQQNWREVESLPWRKNPNDIIQLRTFHIFFHGQYIIHELFTMTTIKILDISPSEEQQRYVLIRETIFPSTVSFDGGKRKELKLTLY